MAFTFNWAGISVPDIKGGSNDYQKQIREDAANWGNAVRGYERKQADKEYADLLNEYSAPENATKLLQLKAEIARLEKRNEEIKAQLGG